MYAHRGLRLAVGHKARVGKDTFADYFIENYGGQRLKFASGVYEVGEAIQRTLGSEVKKDPALLQWVGTGLRQLYGDNIWVDRVATQLAQIDPAENVIITDLRDTNELIWLQQNGFTTIKINRKNRIIDRDPTHRSEIALDGYEFHYTIDNDGTKEEYYTAIEAILKNIQNS